MTGGSEPAKPRGRGNVRRMRDRVQVRVSTGADPSSGERIILVESVMIEVPGNARFEHVALKQAEEVRTRLLADADSLKVALRCLEVLGPRGTSYRPAAGEEVGAVPEGSQDTRR